MTFALTPRRTSAIATFETSTPERPVDTPREHLFTILLGTVVVRVSRFVGKYYRLLLWNPLIVLYLAHTSTESRSRAPRELSLERIRSLYPSSSAKPR